MNIEWCLLRYWAVIACVVMQGEPLLKLVKTFPEVFGCRWVISPLYVDQGRRQANN
jgi:hypothetical protein